jgi:hypothetical protein
MVTSTCTENRPLAKAVEIVALGDAEAAPGRAMRVAYALQAREGDAFAKPGNLVEVRFVRGQSLSLTASAARLDDPHSRRRCLGAGGAPDAQG